MLQLENLSYKAPNGKHLLERMSLSVPVGHFQAVVGPSGCGKSTLLKLINGVHEATSGSILWSESLSGEKKMPSGGIGYVPQFSILEERLSVLENIAFALKLRRSGISQGEIHSKSSMLAESVGLDGVRYVKCEHLSGGQRRRLSLACELVNDPPLLLCDEVTSGLDLNSEDEVVSLLSSIAQRQGRLVLCVTHSFRHLHLFDGISFLYKGRLIYHGPPHAMPGYFNRSSVEEIFNVLHECEPETWESRWDAFKGQYLLPSGDTGPLISGVGGVELPGLFSQAYNLLVRRFILLLRDHSQLALQLSLLLIFPTLVCIFGYEGMPGIRNVDLNLDGPMLEQVRQNLEFNLQLGKIGTLVSGLVLFQAILLALMGANNASREIVAGRLPFEKEKLGGIRTESQLLALGVFLFVLVCLQSAWMAFLVKSVCGLPGMFWEQFVALLLLNGSMTALSLAISSWAKSTEQASLMAVYAVGFQLPLSGVVLALPEFIGALVRPFISTYWAWSAYLQTMKDTRYYDLAAGITNTPVAAFGASCTMLALHIAIGLLVAYAGMLRNRWK